MTVSLYDIILSNKETETELFFERINECAPELFTPIHEAYKHKGIAKNIVIFIALGYSIESKRQLLKSTWSVLKKQLAEEAELPDREFDNIVNLKDETVRKVIADYLQQQGDYEFRHLKMNEDIYECLLGEMYHKIWNEEGNAEVKLLIDLRGTLNKMQEEIQGLRKDLYEKYKIYTENALEGGVADGKRKKITMNPATSPHISR